jgi:hypothetical protein
VRPWGLPPHYAIYPVSLLERTDLAPHLFRTYLVLYALAWRNDYRTVKQSMAQLAEVCSQLEGKPLGERGMRKRIGELAELGLLRREFTGQRWVTRLLLCHEELGAVTGTAGATAERIDATSIVHGPYSDYEEESQNQNQDSSRTGPGGSAEDPSGAVRCELWAMGIAEPTAGELASLEWMSAGYVAAWSEYLGWEAAGGNKLGLGWLVQQMRAGRPAPRTGATSL